MLDIEELYAQLESYLQAGDATLMRRFFEALRTSAHMHHRPEMLLHFSIRRQNLPVVQALLRANSDVNFCDGRGCRAIHIAAETGDVDILRAVVNAGSPINVVNGNGTSPLHACMEGGYQKAALLLIEQGATVNRPRRYDNGEAPIHVAARLGMNDVIRAVIRKGGDVNLPSANRSAPLHLAVKMKHSWTAKVLCEVGADVHARDASGMTPFLLAVQQTSVELVRTLLPFCHDLNVGDSEGSSAIHYISAAYPPSVSQSEILNILISNGADVTRANKQGYTPLHLAASVGTISVMRALLDAGAQLNVTEKLLGETPLNTAAAHNHVEAIRLLAERGADVCIPDKHTMTPLHKIHFCRSCDKYTSTDILLSHGARVNAVDDRGVSPLMWCVSNSVQGQYRMDGVATVRRLVSAGAHLQPNCNRCTIQNSPLCWLTWQGHLDAAAFLVNAGWDINSEVWRILPGKTPAIEEFLSKLRALSCEPWGLQASCRRVIRAQLCTACDDRDVVPLIDKLDVPRAIKQFLTFELEGDEI